MVERRRDEFVGHPARHIARIRRRRIEHHVREARVDQLPKPLPDPHLRGPELPRPTEAPALSYAILSKSEIPLAEETRLMVPLGAWALREACRQCRLWQTRNMPPMRVGVNVSAVQFQRADVVQLVKDALAETRLAPSLLPPRRN